MNICSYIDHSFLKPTTTFEDVKKCCEEALSYQFAAVCIPPVFVREAKSFTQNSKVKTATVIGFPFGYSAIEAKVAEIILAMVDGADELDMVINIAALKNNDWQYLANEINTILPVVHHQEKIIKIIIESGILTDEEIIRCCTLYGAAGVDYLKTSTGYAEKGASVEAVRLMRKNLPASVKIKASGGVKTYDFAIQLIKEGATRLGCSASISIVSQALADEHVKY
jgi:deoxyribose-phosphate aldolase